MVKPLLTAALLAATPALAQAQSTEERAPTAERNGTPQIERPAAPAEKGAEDDAPRYERDRGDFAEEDTPGCGLWRDQPLDLIV